MSIFEATMLICFGLSWPISSAKSVRTKVVTGKSPLFMVLLCCGYLCGAPINYDKVGQAWTASPLIFRGKLVNWYLKRG